ncbi:MAG TPA: Lrp/AsnC family transcriptional regulator [Steroidobacteraceae bacterium]|jgi:DNA-binding Lrp family transcriptional regulator|nr:Lrp/AsnC family transcriptional regulator [Steroidobacteraceae bacterium]
MPKIDRIAEKRATVDGATRLLDGAMPLRAPDLRILRELSRDGRLSNVELARRVRMSESACLRRVRALEEMGAIAGYRAVINPLAFGKVLAAYMLVNLDQRVAADAKAFLDVIRADERIVTCAAVTGEYDLILEVAVKDVADLTDLTLDTLLKLPTVRDVVTCLSLRNYKTAGDGAASF